MARFFSIGTLLLIVALGASTGILRGPTYLGNQEAHSAHQSASPPNATTSPRDMIDGAKQPELIPDRVAFRLFFLTVAEPDDASAERKARQRAYLRSAGLKNEDVQAAAAILTTFKGQHDELVKQYNESVQTAHETGGTPDLATFLSEQDGLVDSTRSALRAALGTKTMDRLEAHVRGEKRNMKMAKEAR